MTQFVQFHLLTPYPPSNPNRDDQGRPKQAMVGGHPRLRLSSQSLKRAVRETAFFKEQLDGHIGVRTRRPARRLLEMIRPEEEEREKVLKLIEEVTLGVGKLDPKRTKEEGAPVLTTMTFFTPTEFDAMAALVREAAAGSKVPKRAELAERIFRQVDGAIDVAMFGRMLAGEKSDTKSGADALKLKQFEREAAVQVGHAITTHRALVEDDYFTAVDDLNKRDDTGAGHLDDAGYGSGVYYLYACVNVDLLVENLGYDDALAARGMDALARALATATPKGTQNSFAHHPLARYIRAERGSRQPRDLSGAFFHPVDRRLHELGANDLESASIIALEDMAAKLDRAYGPMAEASCILNVGEGLGTLDEIAAFAAAAVERPADG